MRPEVTRVKSYFAIKLSAWRKFYKRAPYGVARGVKGARRIAGSRAQHVMRCGYGRVAEIAWQVGLTCTDSGAVRKWCARGAWHGVVKCCCCMCGLRAQQGLRTWHEVGAGYAGVGVDKAHEVEVEVGRGLVEGWSVGIGARGVGRGFCDK
jgi:hypothetical protein